MQIFTQIEIETVLEVIPKKSGVYRYYDKEGNIIYVGKAKNLQKRVSYYFLKEQNHPRVKALLKNIAEIQYTVVDNEYDALLLENNLIKEYRPKYNVQLKDDKTYPWLCITDEPFPRLLPTRRKMEENAQFFGPYASVKVMNALLDMLQQLYPLRRCKLNLTEKKIETGNYKPCLDFHIKKCDGVCVGKISHKTYMKNIQQIKNIIQGNTAEVIDELRDKMMNYAKEMAFEKAHEVKMQLFLLEKYQAKSTIVSSSITNVDVFGIAEDISTAYVCYFNVVNGSIVRTQTVSIKPQLNETTEEILLYAIVDLRKSFQSTARELIIPCEINYDIDGAKITVPKTDDEDKYKLKQLATSNAKEYMYDMQKQKEFSNPDVHKRQLLEIMKKDLQLPNLPIYIECFDNSNLQGQFPVSSMVCFRECKPSKKEYRIYNVQSTAGKPDDFLTMDEVITRRYRRLLREEKPLPDLIVVDGGKGQVSAAYNALKALNIEDKIPLIGIAKRLEEIHRPNDPIPLFIDKKSETQLVIQHLRDEAHRYGISHHRHRRDKALMQTELTDIYNIGGGTAAKLLSVFRSVSMIKTASMEELTEVIGKTKATILYNYYHTSI